MAEVKVVHVGGDESWSTLKQLADDEAKSEEMWKALTDEQRAALLLLARDALRHMTASVAEWLPGSLIARQGERVDVFISLYFAEVEQEVVRQYMEEERNRLIAQDGLAEIVQSLTEEEDAT